MNPTPLPEQGGFDEPLDEILQTMFNSTRPNVALPKARAAIRTLVLEEIIGQDELTDTNSIRSWEDGHQRVGRNDLRAEQRKKLGGTHGTN